MPDGRYAIYEHHNWRHQQLVAQGERLTRMEHDRAAWLRFCEGFDLMLDALDDVEGRHMGEDDIDDARGHLDELKSTMTGIVGDVVRWAGVR